MPIISPVMGAVRPIAPHEEATWELMLDTIRQSGIEHRFLGNQPFAALMDRVEFTAMYDEGVRPSELVEALGERLDPKESGPMNVGAKLSVFGKQGNILGLYLLDVNGQLAHQRAKLGEALYALTGKDIVNDRVRNFVFGAELALAHNKEGAIALRTLIWNEGYLSHEKISLGGIVIGRPEDYGPKEPATKSSMDGRKPPKFIGVKNPASTEKVTDLFLLLDEPSLESLTAAQTLLGEVIIGAQPLPRSQMHPRLVTLRQRIALRRSGLTLNDAKLSAHSVLRDDRTQIQATVATARELIFAGLPHTSMSTRVGYEIDNETLRATHRDLLDLFRAATGRDIPESNIRMWPAVADVPKDQLEKAINAISHLVGSRLRTRGIVMHTVDRYGRHTHTINTAGNAPPTPEPETTPIIAKTQTPEEPKIAMPEVDAPVVEAQPNERQASLQLTDLHREILGVNIRGPLTLASLDRALPGHPRKQIKAALQQLTAAGYTTQDASTYKRVDKSTAKTQE